MAKKKGKGSHSHRGRGDEHDKRGDELGDHSFHSYQAPTEEEELQRLQLIADAWKSRDDLYRQLFGKPSYVSPSSYAPPAVALPEKDKKKPSRVMDTGDPGDPGSDEQHLAVLAYGPDPFRPYWTYVTAGLSTPWLQQEALEVSGFGCELVMKTPTDSPWAIQILKSLAFYVFNHTGTLSPGKRVALNGPISVTRESELRNVFIWYVDEAPDCWYILPSGGFGLFSAIGMTEAEARYAESVPEYGTWCIQEVLRRLDFGQVTDADRKCVMTRDDIEEMKNSVRMFAQTWHANSAEPM